MSELLLDRAGRRRSPATMPGFHAGRTATAAGVRRRFAPHQLGHAHAVEMAREGVPLQGIDNAEIIDAVHARRAPMTPVSASLRL
jgi:hypothetical protein